MGLNELIIAAASGAAAAGAVLLGWRIIEDVRYQRARDAAFAEMEAAVLADIERHPFAWAEAEHLHDEWRMGRAKAEAVIIARNAQIRIEQRLRAAGYEIADAAEGHAA